MAYENVTPPTMPAYDTAKYEYSMLVFNYVRGESDWYQVHLVYATTPFVYIPNGNYITSKDALHGWQIYGTDDNAWTGEMFEETKLRLSPGLKGGVHQRIWTNHDIADENGNVYLAANAITPIKWEGLRSWIRGYVSELVANPLPIATGTKWVRFSFNGYPLPILPELGEDFQFMCIQKHTTEGIYYLYASAAPFTSSAFDSYSDKFAVPCPSLCFKVNINTDALWTKSDVAPVLTNTDRWLEYKKTIWTNYDIPYEGGDTYLTASEPILMCGGDSQ